MAIRATAKPTQADWSPDARGQAVLASVIKEHLRTGEPVASRSISERFAGGAGWSSATIRNVLAELEEYGLVEQPHTSAGRVPTDNFTVTAGNDHDVYFYYRQHRLRPTAHHII